MTNEETFALSAKKEFEVIIKKKNLVQKKLLSPYRSCRRNGEPIRAYCVTGKIDDNKKINLFC